MIGRGIAGPGGDERPVLRLSALQPSPGPCGSTCCQWRDGGCTSPTCPRNAPTLPKAHENDFGNRAVFLALIDELRRKGAAQAHHDMALLGRKWSELQPIERIGVDFARLDAGARGRMAREVRLAELTYQSLGGRSFVDALKEWHRSKKEREAAKEQGVVTIGNTP